MSEAKRDQKILSGFSGAGGVTVREEREDGFSKRARYVCHVAARNCPCSREERSTCLPEALRSYK